MTTAPGSTSGNGDRGASTAFEVSTMLRWTRRERRFEELPPFHRMLAVVETVWHLRLLAAQRRVVAAEDGDIVRYAPAVAKHFGNANGELAV